MRLSVRGKLFLVSLSLITVVGGASFVYLEVELRRWLEDMVEHNLEQLASSTKETFLASANLNDEEAMDRLADRLGQLSAPSRITLITADGRVLGDSSLDHEGLAHAENHAHRPEVEAAMTAGSGHARRYSKTIGSEMMYVAVPYQRGADRGVVRVAMPLKSVDEAIAKLRLLMIVAGMVGLAIAVLMSLLASHLMSRALGRLVGNARAAVGGAGTKSEAPQPEDQGRMAGIQKMANELERSLETLARERSRFETVLDSMSEAVVALDASQKITLVNRAFLNLLQLEASPNGRTLQEVIPAAELGQLLDRVGSGSASEELTIEAPTNLRLLAHAQPLASKDGTVIVMLDVTETRRLETIRKDFVANVSHELRTPVSIIQANAETLLDGALNDPKRAKGFVEALHRHSQRLSRIITDLLDLSRMEAGRYKFDIKAVPVKDAVNRAVDTVGAKLAERRLSIEVDTGGALEVKADAKALEHVLLNLLDNAVKYSPDGGALSIRARRYDDEVRIEVEDRGSGISAEHRERIFERFYRVDAGRARDMGGTGLGLAIVKHLVDSMQGRVGVDPAEPKGSIFWFTLPIMPEKSKRAA